MYLNCGTYAGYKKHKNNKTKPCIECLVANRVYSRARYQKNGVKRQADSRARNIDKVRERERQKNRRRRAALSKPYNELQVISLYGGNCHLCGLGIDFMATRKCGNEGWESGFHVDHLIPLSKGGEDTLENVRPSHAVCNLQKASNYV
jgi:5-methylcytosine-specific restriction endonuclease McrA